MAFFVRAGDAVKGPFDAARLRQLAADGKLKPHHQVSKDRTKWVRASAVKGLEFPQPSLGSLDDDLKLAPLEGVGRDEMPAAPAVPAAPSGSPCPSCAAPMAAAAVLCVQCGYHLQRGSRVETKRDGDALNFEMADSVKQVVGILGGTVALFGLVLGIGFLTGDPAIGLLGLAFLSVGVLTVAAVFLARTRYAVVHRGGQPLLQKGLRIGPVALSSREVDLAPYQEVWFVQAPRESNNTWVLVVMLILMCFGFIPGLIWWLVLLREPEASVNYRTELRGEGVRTKAVLRGGEGAKHDANDLARLLQATARLRFQQELGLIS